MKFVLISIVIICHSLYADYYPIIFVHGQKGASIPPSGRNEAKPEFAWQDWHCALSSVTYRSAMEKILDQHYGGYTAGSPLNCDKNSFLASSVGNTKKIYNFSYYNPDGAKGVIVSNGHCLPEDYKDWRDKYEEALANASRAEHLTDFIERVLAACYGCLWAVNQEVKIWGLK